MTYRKKFIPESNLRKILKHREHPRLDTQDSHPKQVFSQGEGFLSEMRQLDFAANDALKSYALTIN